MHPMERLRHLARAGAIGHQVLVEESVPALSGLSRDSGALVLSGRRLLQHHPASGPLTWLCARVLCAEDAHAEAWRCAREIGEDTTDECLAGELPEASTVAVLGWPEVIAGALARRGDMASLVVDVGGDGEAFELVQRLRAIDIDAVEVAPAGMTAAVRAADLVLLEAAAVGTEGFLAVSGSYAAAAVARHLGIPVWLVAGVGRVLPPGLWTAMTRRLERVQPWTATEEVVPLDLVEVVVRPSGVTAEAGLVAQRADCPDAAELR
ncbi:MAG TPA: hypothetical protein VGR26_08860 [Acidimicrobiales bacterium]|nr:hypothetical protein [Acidimicrobiales bacterium]